MRRYLVFPPKNQVRCRNSAGGGYMTTDLDSPTQELTDSTILRLPQVEARTGLKRAAIYKRIADGLMPIPIRIGARVSGWPAREMAAVNEALIQGRSDDEIRQLVADLVNRRSAGGDE